MKWYFLQATLDSRNTTTMHAFCNQKNGNAKFSRKLTVKKTRVLSSIFVSIHVKTSNPYSQLKTFHLDWFDVFEISFTGM